MITKRRSWEPEVEDVHSRCIVYYVMYIHVGV